MRHAYALLHPGEPVESAISELRCAQLRWDILHVDRRHEATPRPGLADALAQIGHDGQHLVVTTLGRLTADENELIALTAELVERDITLNIGSVILPAANTEGLSLFDRYLTGGPTNPP